MRILIALCLVVLLQGCTKTQETTHTPDGKPMLSKTAGDPETLILEAEINVPKKHMGKIKKSDLMLWDVKDETGAMIAGGFAPVPKFPYILVVRAKQLDRAINPDTLLTLSARVVKFGDEVKPPQKGQLQLLAGMIPTKNQEVVRPAVSQAVLDRFNKSRGISPQSQTIAVGGKIKADFQPATM